MSAKSMREIAGATGLVPVRRVSDRPPEDVGPGTTERSEEVGGVDGTRTRGLRRDRAQPIAAQASSSFDATRGWQLGDDSHSFLPVTPLHPLHERFGVHVKRELVADWRHSS
jgi:hypothetical protein